MGVCHVGSGEVRPAGEGQMPGGRLTPSPSALERDCKMACAPGDRQGVDEESLDFILLLSSFVFQ